MRRWMWAAWLVLIAASFAGFEYWGLTSDNGITLSRTIWDANQAFPLVGFLFGMMTGGLAVHFFWNWDPASQQRIAELERANENLQSRLRSWEAKWEKENLT